MIISQKKNTKHNNKDNSIIYKSDDKKLVLNFKIALSIKKKR